MSRELLLQDWTQVNRLCKASDNYSGDCRCTKQQFLREDFGPNVMQRIAGGAEVRGARSSTLCRDPRQEGGGTEFDDLLRCSSPITISSAGLRMI